MSKPPSIIPLSNIQALIYTLRGEQVMLDSDLAEIYKVVLDHHSIPHLPFPIL